MARNPYLDEIDSLVTAIIDLKLELPSVSGGQAAQVQAEIDAKTGVVNELQAVSEQWRLNRLDIAVTRLKELAASELAAQARVVARLKRLLEKQATGSSSSDTHADVQPEHAPGAVPQGPREPQGPHVKIEVGPADFDALCRVSQSEVGHFAKHGADQMEGAVKAVADTVISRVAHNGFRASVQAVIDQPFQFSAINKLGSWTRLPVASASVTAIVQDYLEGRVAGAPGLLGGATHFLNPHFSSQNALNSWGNHVVQNAVAVFGNDAEKDVHYHGFAPGTPLPKPYAIHFGAWSPIFDGRGKPAASQERTGLRAGFLQTLKTELAFFGDGKHKESNDPQFRRVGDYWQALGLPFDGRSKVTFSDGSSGNPAWSAAFISWTIRQQGVDETRFRGAQAHWKYVNDLLDDKLANPLYDVMDPTLYAPQSGDIVHYGREWAAKFDLSAAKQVLLTDAFYPSHSDFVTDIDLAAGTITTVGGNVDNSVKAKRPKVDAAGLLKPRVSGGKSNPWIAVLRLRVT